MQGALSDIAVFAAAAVRAAWSYDAGIPLMREAMIALSTGQVVQTLRSFIGLGEGKTFAIMPAALPDQGFGAKLVSVYARPGRPKTHEGLVDVRCLGEQARRLCRVFRHALAGLVEGGERELPPRVAVGGGFFIPDRGIRGVGRRRALTDAAGLVQKPGLTLRLGVAGSPRLLEQANGTGIVLNDRDPNIFERAKLKFGRHIARFCIRVQWRRVKRNRRLGTCRASLRQQRGKKRCQQAALAPRQLLLAARRWGTGRLPSEPIIEKTACYLAHLLQPLSHEAARIAALSPVSLPPSYGYPRTGSRAEMPVPAGISASACSLIRKAVCHVSCGPSS